MSDDTRRTTDLSKEPDFAETAHVRSGGRFLPGTSIEILSETLARGRYQDVLFDFDGTVSLIREGWPEIMVPMMVEYLLETPDHESEKELGEIVRDWVARLTGKQTVYQMIQLAEEIRNRGGAPLEPLEYKQEYNNRLMRRIGGRRESLRTGNARAEDMLVPGTLDLLESLIRRGMRLYLASGTDEPYVKEEAELLGLTRYFGENVYGALDSHKDFSKAMVIERILAESAIEGANLLGFGDAYVEIANVKSVGGTAVGVASDEAGRSGKPDPWKRERLISVGADIIIPDYRECATLLEYLFQEELEERMTDRFDRKRLQMLPLSKRKNLLDIRGVAVTPDSPAPDLTDKERAQVMAAAEGITAARKAGRPVVITFGAHLIKNGLAPVLIRMMEEGWVTHVATNGAGSIHDWEFAYQGHTAEDVRANTAKGQFGTWEETGRYTNLAIAIGGVDGLGYGASIAKMIADDGLSIPSREELLRRLSETASGDAPDDTLGALADLLCLVSEFGLEPGKEAVEHPFKQYSVQYSADRLDIRFTVHPGIGYDIIYSHPMNCGGAVGRGAVRDFLSYADTISHLTGGVHVSIGSAIMAPMIFEKSLSMSNNLSIQRTGKPMTDYHIVVVDIQDGGNWDWRTGEPPAEHPAYYLRFCKSFYRMGGTLDYVCLDNRAFMLGLCRALSGSGLGM